MISIKGQDFFRQACAAIIFGWLSACAASANVFNMPSGQTSMGMVPVGNAGNANDSSTGYGSVGYNYNISKYETTIGQYTEFLNAVAKTDTYGLYNTIMAVEPTIVGISRNGSPGSYTYNVIGSANRPIAYISWGDAARFANWLSNGQPTGAQNLSTTEDGSYFLNGATSNAELNAVTRKPGAHFVIPTENEWYKAAYYDPTKGSSNYWLYPMKTDSLPHSALPPGTVAPNVAFAGNFYQDDGIANSYDNGYAVIDSTDFPPLSNALSDAGAYTSAGSFYSTFDQGGNLWEWNETVTSSVFRGVRGGAWNAYENDLRASVHYGAVPTSDVNSFGFRVSEVPEPASAALMGLGGLLLAVGRKR